MMSLMAKLCALCAISALLQMTLGSQNARAGMRMISGLLMMQLTLHGIQTLMQNMLSAESLQILFERLIG